MNWTDIFCHLNNTNTNMARPASFLCGNHVYFVEQVVHTRINGLEKMGIQFVCKPYPDVNDESPSVLTYDVIHRKLHYKYGLIPLWFRNSEENIIYNMLSVSTGDDISPVLCLDLNDWMVVDPIKKEDIIMVDNTRQEAINNLKRMYGINFLDSIDDVRACTPEIGFFTDYEPQEVLKALVDFNPLCGHLLDLPTMVSYGRVINDYKNFIHAGRQLQYKHFMYYEDSSIGCSRIDLELKEHGFILHHTWDKSIDKKIGYFTNKDPLEILYDLESTNGQALTSRISYIKGYCMDNHDPALPFRHEITHTGSKYFLEPLTLVCKYGNSSEPENWQAYYIHDTKTHTGGKTMGNTNETFKTVMSMKMLNSIMKDQDQDLGKLFLMQQMMNGEPLQVTDVIKSKLIAKFSLDDDKDDLSLEKIMLLQMLEGGSIDLNQLVMIKMMGKMLDEDEPKKKDK